MTKKERILHSVLFELFALILLTLLGTMFVNLEAQTMAGIAVLMSALAMTWNYLYNLLFDKAFGTQRLSRKLSLRVLHGLLFELGLVLVTLPILMLILQRGFWEVLALEAAMVIFFLVYAIVYNWLYDIIRERIDRVVV